MKKLLFFPITRIILCIVFCMGTMLIVKRFISQPLLYRLIEDKDVADTFKHCISFSVLLISYFLFSKYFEKRNPEEIALKRLPREFVLGLPLGFFAISLSIGLLYLLGNYRVVSYESPEYSLKLFTLLCTAALVEDLFNRGLIFRIIENWKGTHVALIVAIICESPHIFNPHVTWISLSMILIWGFTMSLLYVYSKSVWLPYFFHVGWNFAQPFYGSNLTGVEDMGHILKASFSGHVLLTGGPFGIEDSVFTIILLLTIGLVCYYVALKSGKIISFRKSGK